MPFLEDFYACGLKCCCCWSGGTTAEFITPARGSYCFCLAGSGGGGGGGGGNSYYYSQSEPYYSGATNGGNGGAGDICSFNIALPKGASITICAPTGGMGGEGGGSGGLSRGGGGGGGGGSGRAAYVKISECLDDNGETVCGPWEYFAAGGGGGAGGAGGPSCRIIGGRYESWYISIRCCEIVDGTNPPDINSGYFYVCHYWCLICGIGGQGGGANNMFTSGIKGANGFCSLCLNAVCYGLGGSGGDAGTGVLTCVNDGGQNPTYMNSWCTFGCDLETCRTCVCNIICLSGANGSGGEGGGAGGMGGKGAPLFSCCGDGFILSWGKPGDDGSAGDPGWVCIKF